MKSDRAWQIELRYLERRKDRIKDKLKRDAICNLLAVIEVALIITAAIFLTPWALLALLLPLGTFERTERRRPELEKQLDRALRDIAISQANREEDLERWSHMVLKDQ